MRIEKWFPALWSRLLGAKGPEQVARGMAKDMKCHKCGSRWISMPFAICEKCGELNPEYNPNRTYGISNKQWQKNQEEAGRLFEGKVTPLNEMPPWEHK